MSNIIPILSTLPTSVAPVDVEFFDPPMCCPTGLCGPTLDQTLLQIEGEVISNGGKISVPVLKRKIESILEKQTV